MTAAERVVQADQRRALDQRLFRLGIRGQTNVFHGHHEGCPVGLVRGATCRCREISAAMRASRALQRR